MAKQRFGTVCAHVDRRQRLVTIKDGARPPIQRRFDAVLDDQIAGDSDAA